MLGRLSRCLLIGLACLPGQAWAGDHLTVLLDWFINPNHGTLIVAQQMGAFARQGLEVSFVEPADPAMPPRLVAAGHGDIAISYQPSLYQQVAQGLPVVRIGVLIDRSLETLETLEGNGIATLADLKGKRIGYNDVTGTMNLAQIDAMLHTAGLSLSDVQLVNVGTALTTSLLMHRVDAMGLDRNFEHFELIEKGAKPIGFDYDKFGVPPIDDLIIEVNSAQLKDARFPRFLAALRESATFIKQHPDDAWKLFIQGRPDLDNALNRAGWDFTIGYFAADPASLDTGKYERFASFVESKGLVKALPPLPAYAVTLLPPEREKPP